MNEQFPIVVVDASVAVKWFVSERESSVGDAWALLERHLDRQVIIAAPFLLHIEILNAVRSRQRAVADLLRISDVLDGLQIELHSVNGPLARSAITIADGHRLSLYDAAYAALALELDAELVTADRRLAGSGACRIRLLGADVPGGTAESESPEPGVDDTER
jgi:predicted nucleic acid-binding protein